MAKKPSEQQREDAIDLKIARERLAEIKKNPKRLVSGSKLQRWLRKLSRG